MQFCTNHVSFRLSFPRCLTRIELTVGLLDCEAPQPQHRNSTTWESQHQGITASRSLIPTDRTSALVRVRLYAAGRLPCLEVPSLQVWR